MRHDLAIFDFDGTLADSLASFLVVMNDAAARYGFARIEAEAMDELRRLPPREVSARLRLPFWKLPIIAPFIRRRMAEEAERVQLFSGAAEMLEAVAAHGISLAIVSSNAETTIRRLLGPRLSSHVAYFGCGASVLGKQRFLRRALAHTSVPASRAIKIGDEIRDLDAARAVRIRFGGVTWGFANPDALRARGADVMFERMEEIGEYLTRDT